MCDASVPAQPAPNTSSWYIRGWATVLTPLLLIAAVSAILKLFLHRFSFVYILIWQPSMLVAAIFSYLRYFHPDRLPGMLSEDSDDLKKLQRRQKILGWVGYLCLAYIVAIFAIAFAANGENVTSNPHIPNPLLHLTMSPLFVSCVCLCWHEALKTYIKERTVPRSKPSSSGPRPAVPFGKPFQSEYWGRR